MKATLPADYAIQRTEHDLEKFQALLDSASFKQAILEAAGLREWKAPPLPVAKAGSSWKFQSVKTGRPRGRPKKRP